MSQLMLFEELTAPVSTVPSVEAVRARLQSVLETLRSAPTLPWSAKEAARWKLVVPQMADWLPADEQEAVRAEFATLVHRLDARAA